ncbi:MAG: hypothetical protein Q8L07_06055 [Sediminibacterium sp.]|nr:hypothetical protein [Sediminibacterium sp.]
MLNDIERKKAKELFQKQMTSFLEDNYEEHNCIQIVNTLENFFCTQQVRDSAGKAQLLLFQKNIKNKHTNVFLLIKKIN